MGWYVSKDVDQSARYLYVVSKLGFVSQRRVCESFQVQTPSSLVYNKPKPTPMMVQIRLPAYPCLRPHNPQHEFIHPKSNNRRR